MAVTITVNAETAEALSKLQEVFAKATEGIAGMVKEFAALASVEGLHRIIDTVAEAEEALGRLSQKTGLMVETLSALGRQAYLTGAGAEMMNVSLGLFATKVEAAGREGGQAAQAFRDLGISLTDANGNLRPMDELLEAVANKFQSMADGPQKAAIATELFGRTGRDLIPVLNRGAEGLREMRENGITASDVQRANEFGEAQRSISLYVKTVATSFVNEMLPALTEMIKSIGELLTGSQALEIIFGAVVVVIKVLAAGITIVVEAFTLLGKAIGQMAAAAYTAMTGDFRGAMAIVKAFGNEAGQTIDELQVKLANIFDPESIPSRPKPTAPPNTNFDLESKTKIAKAQAEAGMTILQADLKTRLATEKSAYERGKEDLQTYFDSRRKIVKEGTEAEINIMVGEVDRINSQLEKSPQGSKERAELSAQQEALVAGIHEKEQGLKQSLIQLDDELLAKERALRDQADERRGLAIETLQQRIELVKNDPTKTELEKTAELLPLLRTKNQLLSEELAIRQGRISEKNIPPAERVQAEKQAVGFQGQLSQTGAEISKASGAGTFQSELHKQMTALKDEFGTVATQIAKTFKDVIGTAISSISNGISGLIEGTETWSQALRQIGTSVLNVVIQGLVNMFAAMVLGNEEVTTSQLASQAATIPGALVKMLATAVGEGGWAAVALIAAAVAAVGIGVAAASGAFAEGGRPGVGQVSLVGEKGPELWVPDRPGTIIPANVTSSILSGGGRSTGNGGGTGSRAGKSTPDIHVHLWGDNQAEMENYIRSKKGQHTVAEVVGKNRHLVMRS